MRGLWIPALALLVVFLAGAVRGEDARNEEPHKPAGSQNDTTEHSPEKPDNHEGSHEDHHAGNDTCAHGEGHEEPITTLPIVTWKWCHVRTPYLVALWVFVCWICKLGERSKAGICCSGNKYRICNIISLGLFLQGLMYRVQFLMTFWRVFAYVLKSFEVDESLYGRFIIKLFLSICVIQLI